MIKIGIVDDHQIVIDGLIALLKNEDSIEISLTANTGKEMLDLLSTQKVDVLLTDVMMPEMNGLELAEMVSILYPGIKILALSMNGEGTVIDQLVQKASISGYLLKQTNARELVFAIQKISSGGQYFPEEILDALDSVAQTKNEVEAAHLTQREIEVICLMEKDLSNKQIADKLNIAVRTVETHRKNIFRKTGTNNILSLVKWAYEHKLISS
ncbi:response regulator transcription factor [Sediminibacterium salmoneum]|uniref:response regulator transcription factor n=1 Tax=Sediminibacterium salmoneum TaxID=426421 RepID=UPI00047ED9B7|nr:response regulator transcription factor [Sediminibacterium salmoneum]